MKKRSAACKAIASIAFLMIAEFALAEDICQNACGPSVNDGSHKIREEQIVSGTIYMDNDLFTGGRKDKDYTGGFAIAFSGADATRHPFSIDRGLQAANRTSGLAHHTSSADLTLNSCEAGLTAFTPDDIETAQAKPDDRPYAGLLYLSNTQQSVDRARRISWVSTLSVGALGLDAVGDIQNAIHKATGSVEAAGWDNQISKGGEPTLRYSAARLKHLHTGSSHLQATTSLGAGIGYLTDVSASASLRWGRLRTPWWNLDEDSGKYGPKAHAEIPLSRQLDEIYLVAGASAHYRLYNALLQGQFRDSEVTYDANEVRDFVYETWIGISCEWQALRVSYIVRQQSSEVAVGLADRSYRYGALIATFRF